MPRPRRIVLPTDCATCEHFGFVQRTPGRWYPCPACHGSGRNDLAGDYDPTHCVRDTRLDPDAHHLGETPDGSRRRRPKPRDLRRAAARIARLSKRGAR